jgi:hypothetical protein
MNTTTDNCLGLLPALVYLNSRKSPTRTGTQANANSLVMDHSVLDYAKIYK